MSSFEFEKRFRELQQRLLLRMEGDDRKISELVRQLSHGDDAHAARAALEALAHQYNGSGRSFGFPQISETAAVLEERLHAADLSLPRDAGDIHALADKLLESFAVAATHFSKQEK